MEHFLGIDLGGTNIAIGVIDKNNKIIEKQLFPTLSQRSFEEITKNMAEAAQEVLKKAGLKDSDIGYVGIGVPSTINPKNNQIVFANNLGWKEKDLISEFQKHWDKEVRLANDADCAALGESTVSPANQYSNLLMLTIGTGLGGGVIIDGNIFRGGDGTGFEPGHMIIKHNGIACTCGTKGCIEAYGSMTALIRETIDKMISYPSSLMWQECGSDFNKVDGKTAFSAAKKGDKAALEVVDEFIDYIASGIASLKSLLRPQVIIIGGGISKEGDYLLDPLRKKVLEKSYASDIMEETPIYKAQLGNDAGIIGAALLKC